MKEEIREILLKAGASAVGFAKAEEINISAHEAYKSWIDRNHHGEMSYLERHIPLKQNLNNVLKDTHTVISLAFSYAPEQWRDHNLPYIAAYAYGEDYHITIRNILKPLIKDFEKKFGGKWRICIDSAPVTERYWALKSGIGVRGINGNIIVKDTGSLCFLTEILTTIEFPADTPSKDTFNACGGCGLCIAGCPGKAITGDGTIDSRKCINYLTIEKKGDFSKEEKFILNKGCKHLYGCDICLRVCPHNQKLQPSPISNFFLTDEIRNLTADDILKMTESEFHTLFHSSPLLYASYTTLHRNAQSIR